MMSSSSNSSEKQKQEEMRGNGGSCEDCGNKAKRDCEHMRCRTCCNSRGLPCPTHVRSTWIPAASRRRRRLSFCASSSSSAFPRPLRLLTTGLEERNMNSNFPAELTAVANFRYVRVRSDDNAVDQAAYQTSVNIAGRSFKGILYDQGPSSSSSFSTPNLNNNQFHHHPGGDGGSTSGGGFAPPPPLYVPPYNPFMPSAAGMQFFFQPKP